MLITFFNDLEELRVSVKCWSVTGFLVLLIVGVPIVGKKSLIFFFSPKANQTNKKFSIKKIFIDVSNITNKQKIKKNSSSALELAHQHQK